MTTRAVHHIALRCADVERTAAFYETVIGLKRNSALNDERGLRAIWLSAGSTIVMCERREPGEPSAFDGDMNLVAFAVDVSEWSELERSLASSHVAIDGSSNFTIYLRDPDGRRVGLSSFPEARPRLN